MASDYVPDHLYERLFQPWALPESEWPLCKEDWARVDAITSLPWEGRVLDVGAGDGTLAAMVCSRNPKVASVFCVEPDTEMRAKISGLWHGGGWPIEVDDRFPRCMFRGDGCYSEYIKPWDGALCCEVLEHLTIADGAQMLRDIHARLKPGGMLCVTVPTEGGTRAVYPGHLSSFSQADLCALIDQAGFTRADLNWIPSDGAWTDKPPVWIMVTARA